MRGYWKDDRTRKPGLSSLIYGKPGSSEGLSEKKIDGGESLTEIRERLENFLDFSCANIPT